MKMVRSFNAVGQGAFYCESFENGNEQVHVVYDCGSSTGSKCIEREIRHIFDKEERIEAVFLSHLDEDHINGIPFLLKFCRVKKIYFPLISSENKLFLKIWLDIKKKQGFAIKFLENPEEAIGNLENIMNERPELIGIEEYEENENAEDDNSGGSVEIQHKIKSGENVAKNFLGTLDWLYIPCNFRQKDRIKQLKDALNDIFKEQISSKKLNELWRKGGDNIEKIKQAYGKVSGTFNTNSTMLFSGTKDDRIVRSGIFLSPRQYFWDCYEYRHICGIHNSGCLYMGDYDASGEQKWNQLENVYTEYRKHIGCIQIPHHGSKHNFNKKLFDFGDCFIISVGSNNRYGHPHSKVMRELLLNGHCPLVVTEHPGSRVYFTVFTMP